MATVVEGYDAIAEVEEERDLPTPVVNVAAKTRDEENGRGGRGAVIEVPERDLGVALKVRHVAAFGGA